MTPELEDLLRHTEPPTPANAALRLRFGLACARRVERLLEDPAVEDCLREFAARLDAGADEAALAPLAERAGGLANRHPGSRSLDGVGHAAVSATYACAKAIAGRARQAAAYAAYAAVYGDGGYGATTQPEAFLPEHEWQAAQLRALLGTA